LRAALEARPITLSWVHGDYCPGNILTGPDGHISAIVDWEFAHPEDLPSLDVVFLMLTARMWARRQEFGRVVSDLVTDPTWTGSEAQLFASAHDARMGAAIGTDTLVLLCWLRHAASKFTRRSGFAEHGLWMHANVHTVLDAFAQAPTRSR
jgi:aminoglycoside phosphotransferase (APT) family kinase protein